MSDDLISRKALLKQFIVSDSGRRIPEYGQAIQRDENLEGMEDE